MLWGQDVLWPFENEVLYCQSGEALEQLTQACVELEYPGIQHILVSWVQPMP